jgi:glutamate--cysteine ligase
MPKVGLEGELFPILVDCSGLPAGRLSLEGAGGVVDTLDQLALIEPGLGSRTGPEIGPWEYQLSGGGKLTFEPGAQIEYSSAPQPSVAAALDDLGGTLAMLRAAFARRKVALATLGIDLWHPVETVPQQLRAGRYTSMAAYYDSRGPWGRVMMRNTCSLQINLDLGPEGVWQERWLLSNLISPLMVATFASSPCCDMVSARSRAWQELDPTRSGFPRLLIEDPRSEPGEQWAEAALEADVLLVRDAEGRYEPGVPGWSFGSWIRDGHPRYGWPTMDDLDYHLTTLFFEVRPRGFLELRAGESLPDHLRPAMVVLVTSLLYDEQARQRALALLEPFRPRLVELWRRAVTVGVKDEQLRSVATILWRIAMDGAERLGRSWIGEASMDSAQSFMERYTFRGCMPADELRRLQERDPALALAWAAGEALHPGQSSMATILGNAAC